MGWNKTMSSTEQEAVEKMALALGRKLQVDPIPAELTAPLTLTVKLRNGEYRKHAFLGGTKITVVSAYPGKKSGTILVCVPATPILTRNSESIVRIEVPLDDGEQVFGISFKLSINKILTGALEKEREEIRLAVEAVQKEERERFVDPSFASW